MQPHILSAFPPSRALPSVTFRASMLTHFSRSIEGSDSCHSHSRTAKTGTIGPIGPLGISGSSVLVKFLIQPSKLPRHSHTYTRSLISQTCHLLLLLRYFWSRRVLSRVTHIPYHLDFLFPVFRALAEWVSLPWYPALVSTSTGHVHRTHLTDPQMHLVA